MDQNCFKICFLIDVFFTTSDLNIVSAVLNSLTCFPFSPNKRNVPNPILLPVSHYVGAAVVNPPVFSFQICNFLRFWQTTLTKVRMDR